MENKNVKPPNKNRTPKKTRRLFLATLAFFLAGCEVLKGGIDAWGSLLPTPTMAPRMFTVDNCNSIPRREGVVAISPEEYELAKKNLKEMFINPEEALICINDARPVATFTPTAPSK